MDWNLLLQVGIYHIHVPTLPLDDGIWPMNFTVAKSTSNFKRSPTWTWLPSSLWTPLVPIVYEKLWTQNYEEYLIEEAEPR